MAATYAFGPLSVCFDHRGSIGEILLSEFDALDPTDSDPDLTVAFRSGFTTPPDRGTWIDDRIWVDDDTVFVDARAGGLLGDKRYQFRIEGNPLVEPATVTIYHDARLDALSYRFCHRLLQQVNWKYITRRRVVADNVLYDLLEPLIHQRLLATDHAFVHASAVSDGDEQLLFPGWGGTGKTSSCVQLVQHDGYTFLADDLAIISAAGEIYPYTKLLQIYPYNLTGTPTSEQRVLEGLNPLNRAQWHALKEIKGPKGVCRRVPPSKYFGEQTYDAGPHQLTTAVYLSRECRSEIVVTTEPPAQLGARAGSVIAHEFDDYLGFARAIHAAEPDNWPSVSEIRSQSESVYTRCFEATPTPFCRIPRETTPAELADYLRREVI